jgi:hypothetical protein
LKASGDFSACATGASSAPEKFEVTKGAKPPSARGVILHSSGVAQAMARRRFGSSGVIVMAAEAPQGSAYQRTPTPEQPSPLTRENLNLVGTAGWTHVQRGCWHAASTTCSGRSG